MQANSSGSHKGALILPESAKSLAPDAMFQLGRLAASHENRAWAREKVRNARAALTVEQSFHEDNEHLRMELKHCEKVLLSFEKFYKKQRHEMFDHFPESANVMEDLIPGSTTGLYVSKNLSL